MAKTKIPKSARNSLKSALKRDDGNLAESTKRFKRNIKKALRQSIKDGETTRTKITWTVSVGDLVKIKAGNVSKLNVEAPVYGIVTYKRNKINYNNQEDEYVIVMTSQSSEVRLHPKSIETIQEV